VVSYDEFDPYGNPITQHMVRSTPYGYTGEWWEAEVGLLQLRARWYEPGAGRFSSVDPWPADPSDPSSSNPYLYVEANPVNRIDPNGMFSNKAIARTFGVDTIDQVMDYFEQHIYGNFNPPNPPRWGLLRLLQDAREGDTLDIGRDGRPGCPNGPLGRFVCQNGKIKTTEIDDLSCFGCWIPARPVMFWWRRDYYNWYFLNGGGPGQGIPGAPAWWKGGYTDWKFWTDLPDFYMVNVGGAIGPGVGPSIQGAYIVDRFGRTYLNVSPFGVGTVGPSLTYAEGYVGPYNFDSDSPLFTLGRRATREDVANVIGGLGESAGLSGPLAAEASINLSGVALIYGFGSLGASWSGGDTEFLNGTDNPDLAWNWVDEAPMVRWSDILLRGHLKIPVW
jgi:RHS repeat-associated protein